MKKDKVIHRVYSNVSNEDFDKLTRICRDYGFKSIYALLQTLLRCLLKHTGHIPQDEEYSMGREIDEMFEEMLDPTNRSKYYQTSRGRREI
jgi:hypothetical protein